MVQQSSGSFLSSFPFIHSFILAYKYTHPPSYKTKRQEQGLSPYFLPFNYHVITNGNSLVPHSLFKIRVPTLHPVSF